MRSPFGHLSPVEGLGRRGLLPPLLTFPAPAPGSAVFKSGQMPDGWTFNPGSAPALAGFDGFEVVGDELVVTLGPTQQADPGVGANAGRNAPRFERAAPAGDFVAISDWSSDPMLAHTPQYAGAGFVLETAAGSARLELYVQDNYTQVYSYNDIAGSTVPGAVPVPEGESNGVERGWPAHHKLERVGNQFTLSAAFDGINYDPVCQFTWAATLTKLAVHCYHRDPGGATTTFRLKRVMMEEHGKPSVRPALKKTTVLQADFSDLSGLVDASAGGGTAVASGGVLTLACTTANGSTARVRTAEDFGPNVGQRIRARRITPSQASAYFCAVINGLPHPDFDPETDTEADRWAGMYSPIIGNAYEMACGGDAVRIVRCMGAWPGSTDGAEGKYTYFAKGTPAEAELDDLTYIEFQRVGPWLRAKTWDAASAEPEGWDFVIFDEVAAAEGCLGLSLSHNLGNAVSATVEVDEWEIYEIA